MKRFKIIFLILGLGFAMASCGPTDTPIDYDVNLLFGEWVEGTVHDTYLNDGSGYTWDTADDITEDEALPFNWSLIHDELLITHVLWNGTIVPKSYTVTTLNANYLVYSDDYGNTHEYRRVSKNPESEPETEDDPS